MIERFRVQNYKALRDVTLDLTPMHVLIGPNDSGKTSILEALMALCRSVDRPIEESFGSEWTGRELVWWGEELVSLGPRIETGNTRFEYDLVSYFPQRGRNAKVNAEVLRASTGGPVDLPRIGERFSAVCASKEANHQQATKLGQITKMIHGALSDARYYRFNPRLIAGAAPLDASKPFQMEESGFGLPRCLDSILGYDRSRFHELEERFHAIFPDVKSIQLPIQPVGAGRHDGEPPADGKGIQFKVGYGQASVSAAQASDGMLLVLAYLTVLHLPEPPRLLLIEEPENGIHPKRLQDVLKILRELVAGQSHTQVLMTTHSPYALDEFKPEEVTLCQKGNDGAVSVYRLGKSEEVKRQLKIFSLGEIWSGEGEASLAKSIKDAEGSAK